MKNAIRALAALVLLTLGIVTASAAHADGVRWTPRKPPSVQTQSVFTVYLDPAGSDANNGLTAAAAVYTIERAESIVAAAAPTTDVEVRIAPGTYITNEQAKWRTYVPGRSISFLPTGWNPGDPAPQRPMFVSDGHPGYWLWAELPPDYAGDGETRLRFYYLELAEYAAGGLALLGTKATGADDIRRPTGPGLNGNLIYGLKIHHSGTTWNASGTGYAGVKLENSSRNVIRATHFLNLENPSPIQNLVHGVYLAHGSSENDIYGNSFKYISGHPVAVRNVSNWNDIHDNTFTRTGWAKAAYYSEWFCDTVNVCYGSEKHPNNPRECASEGNWFRYNDLVSGYDPEDDVIPAFILNPPGGTYAGGAGCELTEARLRTNGNVRP